MRNAETHLRSRLEQVGLAHHADALVELASPAVGLETEAKSSGEMVIRAPAPVRGLEGDFKAVAGGGQHTLALREDGTVVAWGENGAGQLGDGTTKLRRSPVGVRDLTDITAISTGGGFSLALSSSGQVFAWGRNEWGELGDGSRADRHSPAPVPGLDGGIAAIVAGGSVGLALRGDGSVVGWGLNATGAIGIDELDDRPVPLPGLERNVIALAIGGYHRLALTADGTVLAWGMPRTAGLGDFDHTFVPGPAVLSHPAPVEGLPDGIVAIAAAGNHSLALTSEGSVLAWGEGFFGQLGDGGRENRYPPVEVSGLSTGVRAIAAGHDCSYAIKDDGEALSWGWNYKGRLGDGGETDCSTPASMPALAGAAAIGAGLALMEDGSVRVWGGEYPADPLGADARLDLAATKLGGRPDLGAGARWPSHDGRPLSFVAQIDLAQVAAIHHGGPLPPAGLLSFFHGGPGRSLEQDISAVVFSAPGPPLTRREFPEELPDHDRFAAVPLLLEPELSLPPAPPSFVSREEHYAYQRELPKLGPEPRHRLLGHPDPVQDDPRTDGHVLLIQVDDDDAARMSWGDLGRLYYLIQPEDLEAGRFEATICTMQSQ